MALVTISGYPCSGKTRRAQELLRLLEERQGLRVCLVNDESVGLAKSAYDGTSRLLCDRAEGPDTKSEKPARAAFFAAVQRLIASDCVVIADGLNYMKVRLSSSSGPDKAGLPLPALLRRSRGQDPHLHGPSLSR